MTADRQLVEVELGQPIRLLRGQELRVREAGLGLRKVGLTRREPASGFEELGDEYTLTLEVSAADGVKRRSFSWREHDDGEVCAAWVVGNLEIAVDRHQVFTVTRREEPVAPPRPSPAAGLAAPHAGSLPAAQPLKDALGGPAQTTSAGAQAERDLVRTRRKRKKRRRSRLVKLFDRLREALKAIFFPPRTVKSSALGGHSQHRHSHKHRRRSRDAGGQMDGKNLRFEQKIGWVWSLRVSKDGRTIGVMRGANPLALVGTVEDYLVAFGDPRPGCALVLCNVSTLRELALDRELVRTLRSERAGEVLLSLDSSYPRHSPKESGSLTVMTDDRGQTVNSNDILASVFDPLAAR